MNTIKYYIIYSNSLKIFTVFDVKNFVSTYNSLISAKKLGNKIKEKHTLFALAILKSTIYVYDFKDVAKITKKANHDEIKLIDYDQSPEFCFNSKLKDESRNFIKTYLFSEIKKTTNENNIYLTPSIKQVQKITTIDNEK